MPVLGQPHAHVESNEIKDSASSIDVISMATAIFMVAPYNIDDKFVTDSSYDPRNTENYYDQH